MAKPELTCTARWRPAAKRVSWNHHDANDADSQIAILWDRAKSFYPRFKLKQITESDDLDLCRLHVLSVAFQLERFGTGSIDLNAINVLYRNRTKVFFSGVERVAVLKSMVSNGLTPGWYFLMDIDGSQIAANILQYGLSGESEQMQIAAMELFTTANDIPAAVREKLSESAETVRACAIGGTSQLKAALGRLLARHGSIRHIEVAEYISSVKEEAIAQTGTTTKIGILQRESPALAFRECLQMDSVPPDALMYLFKVRQHLDFASLKQGLKHKDNRVRFFCCTLLVQREEVQSNDLEQMFDDPDVAVRVKAFGAWVSKQSKVSLDKMKSVFQDASGEEAQLVFERVSDQHSEDELAPMMSWMSLEGHLAYKVIAKKNPNLWRNRILADLKDNFESFKKKSLSLRAFSIQL